MKKRSTLRLVSKIAFYSIFVIVLALVAMLFISKFTGKVFFVGNHTAVWILTDSMDDEIPPQTYILIEKADPADVKKDDIITFYSDDPVLGGSLNTHRVIEVIDGGKEFVTKGDHNLAEDKYTAKGDKLVGVYVDDIPFLTALGRFPEAKEYFELELKAYPYSALYAGFEHAMLNLARDSQYDIAMSRARLERNLALRGLSLKSENLGQLDHDFDDRPLNWSKLK